MNKKIFWMIGVIGVIAVGAFLTNAYCNVMNQMPAPQTIQEENLIQPKNTVANTTGPTSQTINSKIKTEQPAQEKSLMDHQAVVSKVEGDVKILRRGNHSWQTLAPGDSLYVGDQIRTGKQSYVEIYYDDFYLNMARISENTLAEFQAIEPTRIHISNGSIYNILDGLPKHSSYQVSTPTSVAGVRGTRFLRVFDSVTKTDSTVVSKGVVEVSLVEDSHGTINPEKTTRVTAHFGLVLDPATLKGKTVEQLSPQPLRAGQLSLLEEDAEDIRGNLRSHVGPAHFKRAGARWQEIKTQREMKAAGNANTEPFSAGASETPAVLHADVILVPSTQASGGGDEAAERENTIGSGETDIVIPVRRKG